MSEESDKKNKIASTSISYVELAVVIAATFLIMTMGLVLVNSTNPKIMAQPPSPLGGGKYNFGTISSVQLDKNSKPDWVLSGHWRSNLLSFSSSKQTNASTIAPVFDG